MVAKLKSSSINYQDDGKEKINEIIDALQGASATTTNTLLAAMFAGLPTADPHVVGAPWLNSHVLTISAG